MWRPVRRNAYLLLRSTRTIGARIGARRKDSPPADNPKTVALAGASLGVSDRI